MSKEIPIPIEISARHIHLTKEDLEALFGKGYTLQPLKKLSQANDFAAKETVDIEANEQMIHGVRVVGEARSKTQLEITFSDAYKLKMDVPVRLSGDTGGSRGFRIIGPAGVVDKKEGMIIAKRHIHMNDKDAKKYKLKDGDEASLKATGLRETTFHGLIVRIDKGFKFTAHIDTDEANAAGIKVCGIGKLIIG